MSFVGYTYEIDAETEVIYVSPDTPPTIPKHEWTADFDAVPYIYYRGRGNVRDFWIDSRFRKVLELGDEDKDFSIPVTCKAYDARYGYIPWDQDTGIVKFLVDEVTYNPLFMGCLELKDAVVFENAGTISIVAEATKNPYGISFSVRLIDGTATTKKVRAKVLSGTSMGGIDYDSGVVVEHEDMRVYFDSGIHKFSNNFALSQNETILKQAALFLNPESKPVAVIADTHEAGYDYGVYDSSTYGLKFILDRVFPEYVIFEHRLISEENANDDSIWDSYGLFVYIARGHLEAKADLGSVKNLVGGGSAGLLCLGAAPYVGTLCQAFGFSVTDFNVTGTESISDSTHPIMNTIDQYLLEAQDSQVYGFGEYIALGDVELVEKDYIIEHQQGDQDLIYYHACPEIKIDDNLIQKDERKYFDVEIYDIVGAKTNCGRHTARVQIVDDETQIDIDESDSLTHTVNCGDGSYGEIIPVLVNSGEKFVESGRYLDLTASRLSYAFVVPRCGLAERDCDRTWGIQNTGGTTITVDTPDGNSSTLSPGQAVSGTGTFVRRPVGTGLNPTDTVCSISFNKEPDQEAQVKVWASAIDYAPCPGEPPVPVDCILETSIFSGFWIPYNVNELTLEEYCTNIYIDHLFPICGYDLRQYVATSKLKNNSDQTVIVTYRNELGSHTFNLSPGGSATTDVTCVNVMPDENNMGVIFQLLITALDSGESIGKDFEVETYVDDSEICSNPFLDPCREMIELELEGNPIYLVREWDVPDYLFFEPLHYGTRGDCVPTGHWLLTYFRFNWLPNMNDVLMSLFVEIEWDNRTGFPFTVATKLSDDTGIVNAEVPVGQHTEVIELKNYMNNSSNGNYYFWNLSVQLQQGALNDFSFTAKLCPRRYNSVSGEFDDQRTWPMAYERLTYWDKTTKTVTVPDEPTGIISCSDVGRCLITFNNNTLNHIGIERTFRYRYRITPSFGVQPEAGVSFQVFNAELWNNTSVTYQLYENRTHKQLHILDNQPVLPYWSPWMETTMTGNNNYIYAYGYMLIAAKANKNLSIDIEYEFV